MDHMQIFVLIAVAIASVVKHRMDAKTAGREEDRGAGEPVDPEDMFGPDTVWPPVQASVPPPLVRQAKAAGQSRPPVVADSAAILKQQQEIQQQLLRIKASKATTSGGAAATRHRVSAAQRHATTGEHPAKADLRGSLRHRKDLRRAIVLREVLGPPVGLR